MEIRKVPISLLNAAPYNPRKDLQPGDPEYQKIARSIEKYGCVEPIIWNEKTGNVIGGHQRLKVLAATGAVEVDVSVVQLSLEDEKALNLALNKISGQWDNEKLSAVLQDLSAGFDVEVTGFDQHEVDALVACTDVKMIAQNSFCTSADSTSWLSGVKYGWFDDGNQKAHINQFRKDLIEQRLSAVRTITEGRGLELTDKTLLYGARASLCATICKQKYTRAVGSQE